MKKHYDVVIVGAGIAGLECANQLKDSNLNILLLEKNRKFYNKSCAGGLMPEDLEFVDSKYLRYAKFKQPVLKHKSNYHKIAINNISSFDRARFLKDKLQKVKKQKNLSFEYINQLKIINEQDIVISSRRLAPQTINFKYLVGADGSTSQVRKYLKLENKNPFFALCYDLKNINYNDFICEYIEDFLGYFWIFPHKNLVNIGAGGLLKQVSPKKLKSLLQEYIKKLGLKPDDSKLTGALINHDYQGYRFGNIYLAGDAAGLASGLTGKGIYPAHLSAKQIASDILGQKKNHLSKWLSKKNLQEKYLKRINTKIKRKIFFNLGIRLIKNHEIEKKLAKLL